MTTECPCSTYRMHLMSQHPNAHPSLTFLFNGVLLAEPPFPSNGDVGDSGTSRLLVLEIADQVEAQPLRCYSFRFPCDQISSKDLRNPLALRSRASSSLRKILLIHQTLRPPKARATRPSWIYPQFRCSITRPADSYPRFSSASALSVRFWRCPADVMLAE